MKAQRRTFYIIFITGFVLLLFINVFVYIRFNNIIHEYDQLRTVIMIGMVSTFILFSTIMVIISFLISKSHKSQIFMEQSLITEANRTEAMINNLPGMVFQSELNKTKLDFVYCSEGCLALTGYTRSELLGNPNFRFYDIVHPDDSDKLIDNEKVAALENKVVYETEFRIITKNGDEKVVWERSRIVDINHTEDTIFIEGFLADITEHRRLEALQSQYKLMEILLNSFISIIYVNDPDTGEILFVNEYMKQYYDIQDDLVGKICHEVMPEMFGHNCELCSIHKLREDPDAIIIWDEYNSLTDATYQNCNKLITWINGKTVHFHSMIDISELVIARNLAEQSSRAKSDFLAKMSHEIRTPMNAIMGMAEIALREKEPESKNEHLVTVKQASSNLLSLINDILDLSKIETGKLDITPAEYDFCSLINDIISIIRMKVLDSQIRFVVHVDSNIPATLSGDEARIRQALINVLGNAVKYTSRGYVALSVYGDFDKNNVINITFEVIDSGIGIKQDEIDLLFEDFVQLDLEKNKGVEGAGLGLAITKGIINAMGGNLGVESTYGKGSTFTITIPQRFRLKKPLASINSTDNKKILLYERREIYANSILSSISNLGLECMLVSNDDELNQFLSDTSYGYLLISFFLYSSNKESIIKYNDNLKVIVLTEFAETIPDLKLRTLSMPVYSASIANIINDMSGSNVYNTGTELYNRFSAPSANVLLVDDIDANLKVARGLMMPYNMNVDICKNGKEAIEAVKSKDYDVVFMDHKMPEMDGVEATWHIRRIDQDNPYYDNLPIVALTANAVTGSREMFLQNGFTDFMSKPIDINTLNNILEKYIPKDKKIRTVN